MKQVEIKGIIPPVPSKQTSNICAPTVTMHTAPDLNPFTTVLM